MAIRKSKRQVVMNSNEAAQSMSATYRAAIITLLAGEQTAKTVATIAQYQRLLAIAER